MNQIQSTPMTWGEMMDVEDPLDDQEASSLVQGTSQDVGCQRQQSSQPPTHPATRTPGQRQQSSQPPTHQATRTPGQRKAGGRTRQRAANPPQADNHARREDTMALLNRETELARDLRVQLNLKTQKLVEVQQLSRLESRASSKKLQELEQQLSSLRNQLDAEIQKSEQLLQDNQQLRLCLPTAHQVADLERIGELEVVNAALKKELQARDEKDGLMAEHVEILTNQLLKTTNECSELTSRVRDQEDVIQALQGQVEELRQESQDQDCVQNEEPSTQLDTTTEETAAGSPTPEPSENNVMAPEAVPSQVERISLWRRLKKALTPKCCRQYKNQRQQQE